MEAVWLAAIVAVGALLTTALNGWMLRRSKREDYARQDAVALAAEEREHRQEERVKQVAAQAEKVATQAEEAARLLIADNAKRAAVLEAAGDAVNGKLDQIHTLVNSALSKAIEDQLEATEQQMVLLREVVELHRAAGREPSQDTVAAINRLEARLVELRAQVADRARQTEVANAQRADTTTG